MQIKSTQRPNQCAVARTLKLFLRELPCGHCPSLFFPLTAVTERNSHLVENGSSCLCRERLRPGSHAPASCWRQLASSGQVSRGAQDQTAPGAAGHLPADLLGYLPVQRKPRWREGSSYLLLLLLYFWWVSSSALVLEWSPQCLSIGCVVCPVSDMLGILNGMDPAAPSGGDPCLDPR